MLYLKHEGDVCPITPDCKVAVDLGDGSGPLHGQAREFNWGPGLGEGGAGRILRYAVMSDQPAASPRPLAAADLMSRTVLEFHEATGVQLTAEQGWRFIAHYQAVERALQ